MPPPGAPTPQPAGGSNPTPLAPGQLVGHGRYELKRMLDKGGMSSVWLAEDSRLHEKVALKFLPPEILNDPVALQEMQRETTKSRKFSHPNIIRIYDLHESPDEIPFISMEYVEGDNLYNLSGQQPHGIYTWEQLKPLIGQLCQALTYAHGEGVIHRDLKPSNMMVDTKGRLKLADFGISMTVDESQRRGNANPINGTLGYMSPQQLSGHPAHVTDDIHALGATLYELLTGRRPFHEGDLYAQVLNQKAKPLNETLWEQGLTNNIPPEVSALIMACLAKDPAMRPASAKVVAEWLGLKDEEASGNDLVAQAVGGPSAKPSAVKKSSNTRWIAALAGIMVLAGGGIFLMRSKSITNAPVEKANAPAVEVKAVLPVTNIMPVGPVPAPQKAKITPGSFDESFNPGGWPNKIVFASARQSDGKFLIGGNFSKIGEQDCSRLARYNPDGSLDLSFSRHGTFNDEVYAIGVLPDGKLLVGGQFTAAQAVNIGHLARLNPDGSLDRTFPIKVADFYVHCILVQPDGKAIISGRFTKLDPGNITRNRIARLNADGTLDTTFNIGTGADDNVERMLLQKDGRIVISGKFKKFNGSPYSCLARLMPNGTLDASFNVGQGLNAHAHALEQQPDGKILVGGTFTKYDNVFANYIVRLNPDGSRDKEFYAGTPEGGANAFVGAICMEGPEHIWVGGMFTTFNKTSASRLVRLTANGRIDPGFVLGYGVGGSIRTFTLSPGEGMMVGGNYDTFQGMARGRFMRLHAGTEPAKQP